MVPITLPRVGSNGVCKFLGGRCGLEQLSSSASVSCVCSAIDRTMSTPRAGTDLVACRGGGLEAECTRCLGIERLPPNNSSVSVTSAVTRVAASSRQVILCCVLRRGIQGISGSAVSD